MATTMTAALADAEEAVSWDRELLEGDFEDLVSFSADEDAWYEHAAMMFAYENAVRSGAKPEEAAAVARDARAR